ncbi:MAG: hypothetical protein ACKPKO_29285, partial [Candidatus Fonsibacter sp.]
PDEERSLTFKKWRMMMMVLMITIMIVMVMMMMMMAPLFNNSFRDGAAGKVVDMAASHQTRALDS